MDLRLLTLNVRGFRNKAKQNDVINLAKFLGVSIVLVQETYFHKASQGVEFDRVFNTVSYWSYGEHNARGVGIIFLQKQQFKILKFERDMDGRLISVDVVLGGNLVRIINVYGPTKKEDSLNFYREELPYFFVGAYNFIIGGDFNCVTDAQSDTTAGKHMNSHGGKEWGRLTNEFQLLDLWLKSGNGDKGFTRITSKGGSRIDRFYATEGLARQIQEACLVETIGLSDHMGLIIHAKIIGEPRRQRPWKMNVRLLEEKDIDEKMRDLIKEEIQKEGKNYEWWQQLKNKIREKMQQWGKIKASQRRELTSKLQQHIRKIQNGGEGVLTGLSKDAAKNHLVLLREERWQAVQYMAAKETHDTEAWCSRKLLSRQLRKAQPQMLSLVYNGKYMSQQKEMELAARAYFSELYENNVKENELYGSGTEECLKVTATELEQAMKWMKTGKAPGPDGIPVEFYKKYWPLLGPSLVSVLNKGLSGEGFPQNFVQGTVVLINKNKGDIENLAAWRPITLLNIDYKILAKVIANKIQGNMGDWISEFQAASVSDRYIHSKIWELRDTIEWCYERETDGILLSVDQKQAFDRINHSIIRESLIRVGAEKELINAVGMLYRGATSRILVNGNLTGSFNIKKGVRQGCPLSPYLYVIVFDALLKKLNGNLNIKMLDLPIEGNKKTITAFADDLTVVVRDEKSVAQILQEIKKYGQKSGAKLNKEKSKLMYLGRTVPKEDFRIKVVDEVKILGITFNKTGISQTTWDDLERECQLILKEYGEETPLTARAEIIKRLIMAKCAYFFGGAAPTKNYCQKLEKMCFQFIWKGKNQWVKQWKLKLPLEQGGLKMPDFQELANAQALQNVYRVLRDEGNGGKMARFWLGTHIKHFDVGRVDLRGPKSERLPSIYKRGKETILRLRHENKEMDVMNMTARDIYNSLNTKESEKYKSEIIPEAWKRINSHWLDGRRRTLLWKIAHGVIPVKDKFYMWGKSSNTNCAACGQPETVKHAIFECRMAKYMWACFKKYFQLNSLTYEEAIGLHIGKVAKRQQKFYGLIAAEIAYQIWTNRCRINYGGICWGKERMRARVSFFVKLWLGRELVRRGEEQFKVMWQCSGFRVEGGTIKFQLKDYQDQQDREKRRGNTTGKLSDPYCSGSNSKMHERHDTDARDTASAPDSQCDSNGIASC